MQSFHARPREPERKREEEKKTFCDKVPKVLNVTEEFSDC